MKRRKNKAESEKNIDNGDFCGKRKCQEFFSEPCVMEIAFLANARMLSSGVVHSTLPGKVRFRQGTR